MNKTLSIGLAGFSFTIEEHAYIKLSDYLAALRNSLEANEADEVMHDIEIRMVEIFKDSLGKREVINDDDVEKVIAQIGKPEVIEEQEEAYFSEKTSTKKNQRTSGGFQSQKQLFRDPEKQKIAGVCAGLAHYVGMDVAAMRAIWVGLFLIMMPLPGSPMLIVFLYLILWLVMPKAETAADFLKMKGKPINFDNIKEESNKIVQFANESTQRFGEIYNENKPYINKAGNGFWNVIRYILGALFGAIGLVLLFSSFAVFGVAGTSNINFFDNLGFYLQDSNLGFLAIAVSFLTIFIPALVFCYIAMKLFSPKTKLNNTGYVFGGLVLLWMGLIAATGFTAIKFKSMYSGNNDETENVAINTTSDSILVDVKKVAIPQNFKAYWDDVYSDKKTIFKQDYPSVDVKRMDVKAPYLEIKKSADGYNLPLKMQIPVEIIDNKIMLPNYFTYPYDYRFRDYRVDYELVVPKNMKVIALNDERGFSVNDEEMEENDQDSTYVNSASKSVVISAGSDSVIVNGKKVSEAEADLMMKKIDKKELKDINITVKDGKKEIIIKTK
ncbi:PspC domain-containing protein [Candidatus Kaistella beijingensis]|uniref:PspC domain-containing protein n=1 Tax=Candidatus Kaistella beijingensis TaxID=2820270 RepID=UPI001CC347E3|nr:PspC domain-containing protein [Candidatus Kaistella beijingensis]UBB89606.1 PspC domain-containing protein [Candidatus Kaistella beijingensis]